MGVYIKGVELPFTCLTCDFHKCAGGVGDFCSLTKRRQFRFKNRPKDCPLVPVPPHGRLIEEEELIKKAYGRAEKSGDMVNVLDKVISVYDIRTAPTIIEAEEG